MSLIPAADLCRRCSKSWLGRTQNKLRVQVYHELDNHLEELRSEITEDLSSEDYYFAKAFVERLRLLCYDCDIIFSLMANEIEKEVLKALRKKVYPDWQREDLEFTRVETSGKVVSIFHT